MEEAAERFLRDRGLESLGDAEQPGVEVDDRAVAQAWKIVGQLSSTPEMMRLRQAALRNASRAATARWRPRSLNRRFIPLIAAGLLVAFALPVATYVWNRRPEPQVYAALVGERRVITLPDRSKIFLDRGSEVSVSYWHRRRDIQLLRGQAEFEVAKDTLRPFAVSAGGRRVIATGTLFSVDLLAGETIVTLLHGGVVVETDAGQPGQGERITLRPAERLVLDRDGGSIEKTRIDLLDAQAWKSGKLIFEVEPLENAIARVNRYARRKVILAAPDKMHHPISGVFNEGDSAAFAEAVATQLGLRTEDSQNAVIILEPSPNA
jgi:transmembrane sensor